MNTTKWQNSWVADGKNYNSDFGWEIRRFNGQQFSLYRGETWHSVHSSISEAKLAADDAELETRRAEWGTGAEGHTIIEGRGGLWDLNVIEKLLAGQPTSQMKLVRDVADNTPDEDTTPVVCVPVELIYDGAYVYREYILMGPTKAKAQFAAQGYFDAIYFSFADAEVARVPDVTDTPENRVAMKALYKSCLKPESKYGSDNPWKRSSGDPLAMVRKYLAS